MSAFTVLEHYLDDVKRRFGVTLATRGFGVAAAAALVITLACVAFANRFAFATWSVIGGRTILYLAVGAVVAAVLVRPLLAMRRRGGRSPWVRRLEDRVPAFEERVQTFVDQGDAGRGNPMIDLLAEDTLRVAEHAPPSQVASSGPIWTFTGVAVAALAVLIWLGVAGPGWLGYGTARLWAGWLKPDVSNLYQISVQPGSTTVRRKAELLIGARPVGFYSPSAHLFTKFASSARWEEAPMQRRLDDTGFEFLFAAVDEPLRYYIAAGNVRSPEYDVRVVEMPAIKKVRLTYRFPSWTGLAAATEDPGGDIRAVAGTDVDVEVETDRPLSGGVLRVNGTNNISLRADGNWNRGRLAVEKDGRYFIAAIYNGEVVRLSDDFFIEATPDRPPTIKISRPGRDYRATPIEEVAASLEAQDDFGLKDVELRYAVNGGPQKSVSSPAGNQKQASFSHLFPLENFSLVPGDVVSYYGVARDARAESKTDIFFIEVQPFEREFFQSQQMAGGQGGGEEDESSQISRRQKDVVAATWNLARERNLDKQKAADNAKILSNIQSKLRDQAQTLAERMKRRQLVGASSDFQAFADNMEKAAQAMAPAAEKLSGQKWDDALPPEQKALQYLLRAEAIFRQIQVAFGNQGGGGGGGGMGRDLSDMFNLELDLEKNQYEVGQQNSAQERDRKLDDALEKLRQLARRQEQLAEQQRRQQALNFDQRWQQEMLRREAEELKRQLEQLQQQQQSGQQSARSQQGQQGQQGSQGSISSSTLQRTLERLQQATRDMQAAAGQNSTPQQPGSEAEQRAARERAQQRLREAEDLLANERRQRSSDDLEGMERSAAELAARQQALANKLQESLRQALEGQNSNPRDPLTGRPGTQAMPGPNREQSQAMARDKEQMLSQLEALEKRMQDAARRMAPTQPDASSQLRKTLGEMQQNEIATRLRLSADLLKRGMGLYAAPREDSTTRAMQQLRQGLQETRRLAQADPKGGDRGLDRALERVENLRRQLERAMAARQGQQSGQQHGQQPGQQQGQQGQQGGDQQASNQQGQAQQGNPGGSQQNPGQRGEGRFGGRMGGGEWRGWGGDASNRGDWQPPASGRIPTPEEAARMFRDGGAELSAIERALRSDPDFAADIEELRREMRGLPSSRFQGNHALLAREQQRLLQEAQQLELLLRRKVEEKQGAQVRSGAEQPVPEQYRNAVAEYFRRLSKEKEK